MSSYYICWKTWATKGEHTHLLRGWWKDPDGCSVMTKTIHQSLGSWRERVERSTLRKLQFDSPPPLGTPRAVMVSPEFADHPEGTLMITLEVSDSKSLKSCLPSWRMSSSWEKWTVTPFYPLLSPQWLLTRHTSHLESPHSDSVTIHGHHFLKDKCLQKVPFILLSELHCLLPSRDPEVEE